MSPERLAATLAAFARLEAAQRHTPRPGRRLIWCNVCKAHTLRRKREPCPVCALRAPTST
jgi:hypothetical protein